MALSGLLLDRTGETHSLTAYSMVRREKAPNEISLKIAL